MIPAQFFLIFIDFIRNIRYNHFVMKIFFRKMKTAFFTPLLILCMLSACGCQTRLSDPVTVTGYKLNTYVQISSYINVSKSVLNGCLDLCDTYEQLCSRTLESSTLYAVNHRQTDEIPAELGKLIATGLDYCRISGGAFDITIGSVSQLWDFTAEQPIVPDAAAIANALQYVDYTKVELAPLENGNYRITMPEGTVLDLGAIAKGYIADKIKDYLLAHNVTSAIINLGGNVLCVGGKSDSKDFTVGVKKPFTQSNELLLTLNLRDCSVVSSGTYERYFYENDTFYHHILNPATGYPYDNRLTDVTILSAVSLDGDCLSTTCFALGLDNGLSLIESLDNIEAVFVTADGSIYYSSGMNRYLNE